MDELLLVGGRYVKAPQEFSVGYQTIDADTGGRNASGTMVRDIISEKVKLEIKWGPLSDGEIFDVLNAVDHAFFEASYPNPKTGGMATKTFYVGDRTAPLYSWNEKFGAIKWQGLSMNFIEK